jgi:hypothetical protein
MTVEETNRSTVEIWTPSTELSERVVKLRKHFYSFNERTITNEPYSFTTGTEWDEVYAYHDRATGKGRMPPAVLDRFNMVAAVKILAYVSSSGFPRAFPAFGMLPASENLLVVDRSEERKRGIDLRDGQRVAVSLVTQEPAAFQVKGEFKPIDRKTAAIVVDNVYACSLPRPGLRIDQPLLEPDSR